MSTKLLLDDVTFLFGAQTVVDKFSLSVDEGSFTTLLGPSGCGKTTLLRLISGFLEPSSGRILIDGADQRGIEVNERKVGMVFQDYALFPHMSVRQNIAYGLKIQKNHSRGEISDLIFEASRSLGIEGLLPRFPNELSGGQQQRVALARAVVLKPKLLLMDEPLSSLDTKLRARVREELKEIQQELGITTVYVTHDQEEALSLSTKIAVIRDGKMLQEGSPRKIYFEPANQFVADFVGKANIIKKGGRTLMIRPEWFKIAVKSSGTDRSIVPADRILLDGTIVREEFLGGKTRFLIQTADGNEIITADFDTIDCGDVRVGGRILLEARRTWEM